MYTMTSETTLAQVLNHFSAPMFAVERASAAAPFFFVGINKAMEIAGNCAARDLVGKQLDTLMPPAELATVLGHYEYCVSERKIVRFEETFTVKDATATWDTTLQYIAMPNGCDRIVGTTVQQPVQSAARPNDTGTFDDIHYFSAMADFQLQNLITMFETQQGSDLFRTEAEVRLAKLSGMCRTVQRAVEDIKKVVSNAQQRNQPFGQQGMHTATSTARARTMRSGMLNALITSSSDWDQHSN